MPKRIETCITKVVAQQVHFRVGHNDGQQGQAETRETILSHVKLPPLADIDTLLREFNWTDIQGYLSQEVISEYSEPSQETTEVSNETYTRRSTIQTTQKVIYRPLAETLMQFHGDALTSFLNAQEKNRRKYIITVLSGYEGFWNASKITQIKMSVKRWNRYGQDLINREFDPKGSDICNHAAMLKRNLENRSICFNGQLQKNFISAVDNQRLAFGKHRHLYRDIALHILAIIGTGVVGYAIALTVSRFFTGKWTTLLQTGSERKLDQIVKNARR